MRKAALLLPVCLAFAGCGGSSSSSSGGSGATTAAAPAAGSTHTVSISESEYKLSPSTISIAKQGKVTFRIKNTGQIAHALEIEGNGVETETEHIAPGESGSLTVSLSKNGDYEMYCPIDGHRDKGMEGTIQVGASAGGMTTEGTTTGGTTTSGGYGY